MSFQKLTPNFIKDRVQVTLYSKNATVRTTSTNFEITLESPIANVLNVRVDSIVFPVLYYNVNEFSNFLLLKFPNARPYYYYVSVPVGNYNSSNIAGIFTAALNTNTNYQITASQSSSVVSFTSSNSRNRLSIINIREYQYDQIGFSVYVPNPQPKGTIIGNTPCGPFPLAVADTITYPMVVVSNNISYNFNLTPGTVYPTPSDLTIALQAILNTALPFPVTVEIDLDNILTISTNSNVLTLYINKPAPQPAPDLATADGVFKLGFTSTTTETQTVLTANTATAGPFPYSGLVQTDYYLAINQVPFSFSVNGASSVANAVVLVNNAITSNFDLTNEFATSFNTDLSTIEIVCLTNQFIVSSGTQLANILGFKQVATSVDNIVYGDSIVNFSGYDNLLIKSTKLNALKPTYDISNSRNTTTIYVMPMTAAFKDVNITENQSDDVIQLTRSSTVSTIDIQVTDLEGNLIDNHDADMTIKLILELV